MMTGLSRSALLAIWLCAAMTHAEARQAPVESRYTYVNNCRELGRGHVAEGEDWVFHRCEGYGSIPVWLRYSDSARSWWGFGIKQNTSGTFSWRRHHNWPLEWRGLTTRSEFQPFAVIMRVRRADRAPGSYLVVYRLREDGTSCIIGSAASNGAARRIADAARRHFSCEQEPSPT